MQLDHQFSIPVDVDRAWAGLLDIQRVAAAFPGASLATHTAESFTGMVRVKLGPVGLNYRGEAEFTEIDETSHRVSIAASGADIKGNGNASANVHARLSPGPDGTTVCDLQTNLEITGKAAQFGRGIVVDIGNRILSQFARNLEKSFHEPDPAPTADAASTLSDATTGRAPVAAIRATAPAPSAERTEPESLDALGLLWSSPAARRGLLGLGVLLTLLVVVARRRSAAAS